MCYNINNLPEGIKCVSNDNEDFIIHLSNEQLELAQKNAESFICDLFSNKIIGDDVRMAYRLKYEPLDLQNDRLIWSHYNVESLIKFLDKDFRASKLFVK